MRRYFALVVCALCSSAFAAEPDPKSLVRTVILSEGNFEAREKAKWNEPIKIASKEELAKTVPDKETAADIAKVVDFDKEYVLLFQWSGSGGDRLNYTLEKNSVLFTMKRGLTKDLRQHVKIVAVAKDAKIGFEK